MQSIKLVNIDLISRWKKEACHAGKWDIFRKNDFIVNFELYVEHENVW